MMKKLVSISMSALLAFGGAATVGATLLTTAVDTAYAATDAQNKSKAISYAKKMLNYTFTYKGLKSYKTWKGFSYQEEGTARKNLQWKKFGAYQVSYQMLA